MGEKMITGNELAEKVEAAAIEEQAGVQGEDQTTVPEADKKYTDADVDRIIAKKIAAERQRMQRLFSEEQQESEIEMRERKVRERELKADAKDALIAEGLPTALADLFSYSSKEDFEASYKDVTGIFQQAFNQEAKRRLAGSVPRVGTGSAESRQQNALHDVFTRRSRH